MSRTSKLEPRSGLLAGAGATGALARVVHDDDGEREAALEVPEIREQWSDFRRRVLIDAVQAY